MKNLKHTPKSIFSLRVFENAAVDSRYIPILLAWALLSSSSLGNTPPEGYTSLFNGSDLTGWHGSNPHTLHARSGAARDLEDQQLRNDFSNHWKVENGEMVSTGVGVFATTDASYGNIDLTVEFKVEADTIAGVYVRGAGEIQLLESNQAYDPAFPNVSPGYGSGGLTFNGMDDMGHLPLIHRATTVGKWNTLVIKQYNGNTWVSVNSGIHTVRSSPMKNGVDPLAALPDMGPIALSIKKGAVSFRNLFIREFPDSEAEALMKRNPEVLKPTHINMSYGPDPQNRIHFWKAPVDGPTPLIIHIHGGGWATGGRVYGGHDIPFRDFLKRGISVASVAYRFLAQANRDGVFPSCTYPLEDAKRAVQYIRYNAESLGIIKDRIAAYGGSAGGCTALWLATMNDMADPNSADPVLRESTRVVCAATILPQTSLDYLLVNQWISNNGPIERGAWGAASNQELIDNDAAIRPYLAKYSAYENLTSDDPPMLMTYKLAPEMGQFQKDPYHSPNYGQPFHDKAVSLGVESHFHHSQTTESGNTKVIDFLTDKLTYENPITALSFSPKGQTDPAQLTHVTWEGSAELYDVYLGTSKEVFNTLTKSDSYLGSTKRGKIDIGQELEPNTMYFCRVDGSKVSGDDTIHLGSKTLSFYTGEQSQILPSEYTVIANRKEAFPGRDVEKAFDGSGMGAIDPTTGHPVNSNNPFDRMWMVWDGRVSATARIEFTESRTLSSMKVWNFNMENHTDRGTSSIEILYNDDVLPPSDPWVSNQAWSSLGHFGLEEAPGTNTYSLPDIISLDNISARRVAIRLNMSVKEGKLNYMGLSEVQFFTASESVISQQF
jgi:acetyl esterase/lipase